MSLAYADRHFLRTRALIERYRVRALGYGGYDCPSGLCSADLSGRAALASANSVPNQVAALSGCVVSTFEHGCGLVVIYNIYNSTILTAPESALPAQTRRNRTTA